MTAPTQEELRTWLSTKGIAMFGEAFLTDQRGLELASAWLQKQFQEFYAWKEEQ